MQLVLHFGMTKVDPTFSHFHGQTIASTAEVMLSRYQRALELFPDAAGGATKSKVKGLGASASHLRSMHIECGQVSSCRIK